MLLSLVYVMKLEMCQDDTPQTSLHKYGTITQNTADTPRTSLHRHGTITQNTADTIQTSLHKHGKWFMLFSRVYVMKFQVCQQ
jgi:hypothetical protein